jgi:hypothetical protein
VSDIDRAKKDFGEPFGQRKQQLDHLLVRVAQPRA